MGAPCVRAPAAGIKFGWRERARGDMGVVPNRRDFVDVRRHVCRHAPRQGKRRIRRRQVTCRQAAAPARGQAIEFAYGGRSVRGTVDALFIPPGCEENCIGTVFVSEA